MYTRFAMIIHYELKAKEIIDIEMINTNEIYTRHIINGILHIKFIVNRMYF